MRSGGIHCLALWGYYTPSLARTTGGQFDYSETGDPGLAVTRV